MSLKLRAQISWFAQSSGIPTGRFKPSTFFASRQTNICVWPFSFIFPTGPRVRKVEVISFVAFKSEIRPRTHFQRSRALPKDISNFEVRKTSLGILSLLLRDWQLNTAKSQIQSLQYSAEKMTFVIRSHKWKLLSELPRKKLTNRPKKGSAATLFYSTSSFEEPLPSTMFVQGYKNGDHQNAHNNRDRCKNDFMSYDPFRALSVY